MSKTSTRPMSASRRKTLATHQIASALGADQAAAVTAALEVVADRMAWDTDVQRSLREKYAELVELSQPRQPAVAGPALRPLGTTALGQLNPLARLDPYQLRDNYGTDQLRAVLTRATAVLLKQAVDVVQEREPGTRPASRTKKADMVDYIVEHVAGPGY